jgi:hypothetical protein
MRRRAHKPAAALAGYSFILVGDSVLGNARCGRVNPTIFLGPGTLDHQNQYTNEHRHTNINTMEDFNQPSPERIDLLKRLEEAIGDVTPHFWAACQICDLNKLNGFLQVPNPDVYVQAFSSQISQMVRYCKSNRCVPLL